jgi:hypothetical protein
MPDAFVVTPTTRPAPLNVADEQITILAPGFRTGGHEIFRQAGPEGGGPRPHNQLWCTFRPVRCIGSATATAAER